MKARDPGAPGEHPKGWKSPAGGADLDEGLVEQLTTLAASWSGFNREAIHVDAVRRAARDCLKQRMTTRELLDRASACDPSIVSVFRQAISVGETYFFRSPEHFAFLRERVLEPQVSAGAKSLRAWSAACSTGEEAYSIAACLIAAARTSPGVRLEVLGTDLSAESVRRARLGEYRAWSIRETAPIQVPLFQRLDQGRVRVDDSVRAITTFATHDLLEPVPPAFGEFNVIFCRNVLVYFDADAIKRATEHLAARLVPGGVIVFGVLEVSDPPPGLVSIGGPGLTAFERPLHGIPRAPTRRPRALSRAPGSQPSKKRTLKPGPRKSVAPPPSPAGDFRGSSGISQGHRKSVAPRRRNTLAPAVRPLPSDIKARHLDALHLIEQNQKREALNLLSQIQRMAPSYVAALLDQALLYQKSGHNKLASELMQQILRLTEAFSVETMLPGPEELPVSYYRAAAETFLRTRRAR